MRGTVWEEKHVSVPASEAWKLYRGLQLCKLIVQKLPTLIPKLNVIQGDGSAGTILEVFFAPGTKGLTSQKEKFTVIDDEKRVKVAEVVEGGFLDMGLTLFRYQFEVLEEEGGENQCITKGTIEYELKEEAAANAVFVSFRTLVSVMQVAADYLLQNNDDDDDDDDECLPSLPQ